MDAVSLKCREEERKDDLERSNAIQNTGEEYREREFGGPEKEEENHSNFHHKREREEPVFYTPSDPSYCLDGQNNTASCSVNDAPFEQKVLGPLFSFTRSPSFPPIALLSKRRINKGSPCMIDTIHGEFDEAFLWNTSNSILPPSVVEAETVRGLYSPPIVAQSSCESAEATIKRRRTMTTAGPTDLDSHTTFSPISSLCMEKESFSSFTCSRMKHKNMNRFDEKEKNEKRDEERELPFDAVRSRSSSTADMMASHPPAGHFSSSSSQENYIAAMDTVTPTTAFFSLSKDTSFPVSSSSPGDPRGSSFETLKTEDLQPFHAISFAAESGVVNAAKEDRKAARDNAEAAEKSYPPPLHSLSSCSTAFHNVERALYTSEHLRQEEIRSARIQLRRLREVVKRSSSFFSPSSSFLLHEPLLSGHSHDDANVGVLSTDERVLQGVRSAVDQLPSTACASPTAFRISPWTNAFAEEEAQWVSKVAIRWATQCILQQWNRLVLPWWKERVVREFYVPVMQKLDQLKRRVEEWEKEWSGERFQVQPLSFSAEEESVHRTSGKREEEEAYIEKSRSLESLQESRTTHIIPSFHERSPTLHGAIGSTLPSQSSLDRSSCRPPLQTKRYHLTRRRRTREEALTAVLARLYRSPFSTGLLSSFSPLPSAGFTEVGAPTLTTSCASFCGMHKQSSFFPSPGDAVSKESKALSTSPLSSSRRLQSGAEKRRTADHVSDEIHTPASEMRRQRSSTIQNQSEEEGAASDPSSLLSSGPSSARASLGMAACRLGDILPWWFSEVKESSRTALRRRFQHAFIFFPVVEKHFTSLLPSLFPLLDPSVKTSFSERIEGTSTFSSYSLSSLLCEARPCLSVLQQRMFLTLDPFEWELALLYCFPTVLTLSKNRIPPDTLFPPLIASGSSSPASLSAPTLSSSLFPFGIPQDESGCRVPWNALPILAAPESGDSFMYDIHPQSKLHLYPFFVVPTLTQFQRGYLSLFGERYLRHAFLYAFMCLSALPSSSCSPSSLPPSMSAESTRAFRSVIQKKVYHAFPYIFSSFDTVFSCVRFADPFFLSSLSCERPRNARQKESDSNTTTGNISDDDSTNAEGMMTLTLRRELLHGNVPQEAESTHPSTSDDHYALFSVWEVLQYLFFMYRFGHPSGSVCYCQTEERKMEGGLPHIHHLTEKKKGNDLYGSKSENNSKDIHSNVDDGGESANPLAVPFCHLPAKTNDKISFTSTTDAELPFCCSIRSSTVTNSTMPLCCPLPDESLVSYSFQEDFVSRPNVEKKQPPPSVSTCGHHQQGFRRVVDKAKENVATNEFEKVNENRCQRGEGARFSSCSLPATVLQERQCHLECSVVQLHQQQKLRHCKWEEEVRQFRQRWGCRRRWFSLPPLPSPLLQCWTTGNQEEAFLARLENPMQTAVHTDLEETAVLNAKIAVSPTKTTRMSTLWRSSEIQEDKKEEKTYSTSASAVIMTLEESDHKNASEHCGAEGTADQRGAKVSLPTVFSSYLSPAERSAVITCSKEMCSFCDSPFFSAASPPIARKTSLLCNKNSDDNAKIEAQCPLNKVTYFNQDDKKIHFGEEQKDGECMRNGVYCTPLPSEVLPTWIKELLVTLFLGLHPTERSPSVTSETSFPFFSSARSTAPPQRQLVQPATVKEKDFFFFLLRLFNFIANEEKQGENKETKPVCSASSSLTFLPTPSTAVSSVFLSSCLTPLPSQDPFSEVTESISSLCSQIFSSGFFYHSPLFFVLRHPSYYENIKDTKIKIKSGND